MASDTEIANLAISHLGIGKRISDIETERSQEALACKVFFETSRKQLLRDFKWPFASKIVTLGLVEEDPNDEWAFSYRYPSDCLNFRRILSGIRMDNRQTRIPYKITQDTAGLLILSDLEEAQAEYTVNADDPSRYPPDFVMAFSFLLAFYIAPQIASGSNVSLGDRALKLYQYQISRAQASALNEEQVDEDPQSEFIRTRDGDLFDDTSSRFTPN